MEIKDLLNERKILQEEIERKKLYLDLVEKKIIAIAKDDIRKLYNIYGSIFKSEKEFEDYAKCFIEINNVKYCDQIYIKENEFTFTHNNIEWSIRIPYDLIENKITLNIVDGVHDKIHLWMKQTNYSYARKLTSDNMKECLEFVKNYKGEEYEDKSKAN